MRLIVVGSGSSGNCYLLTDYVETLIIEAGMSFIDVKKALGFQVRSIKGVIISHSHADHSGYMREYKAAGIPVWKPYESESLRQTRIFGGFRVASFEAVHDVPCCGFLITHEYIGKLLYVTDSEYLKYRFREVNSMLIEANYDDKLIDKAAAKFRHVVTGHLSLETAKGCINANKSDALNHIVLCHLSRDGSDPKGFMDAVRKIAPIGCTVDVAVPGLVVDLGYTPF